MATSFLSDSDKITLLKLARQCIELEASGKMLPGLNLADYSPILCENGASFVTLTKNHNLRGCIGALEPYQPLVQDVCEHAAAAATQDPRFPPVHLQEVPLLHIEISRLTIPLPLEYSTPEELPHKLRPGVDGVILRDGTGRATFLPQVWEQLPSPQEFLSHLCQKMGASPGIWRSKILRVSTYQVEEFHEDQFLLS